MEDRAGAPRPQPLLRVARAVRSRARRLDRHAQDSVRAVHRAVPGRGVALTFDDGPDLTSTTAVLDVLAELEVVATFFCVGRRALAHPELVVRMLDEGHGVGSHSYSHPDPRHTAFARLIADDARGRRAVESVTGTARPLFRPPHGRLGLVRGALGRSRSRQAWLWTLDPEDWRPGRTSGQIADIAGGAGPGDVILLHDAVEDPWAPEATDRGALVIALPDIVGRIRARGLELVTLDR